MQVRELMTQNPAYCTPDAPLKAVAQMMVDFDCGAIPVVERRASTRVVGMVTDRDMVCRTVAQGKNPLTQSAQDIMSSPVVTVLPDASVEECCTVMERYQVRRIPVVDEQGNLRGIVSQADLARAAPQDVTAEVVREVSRPAEAPSRVPAAQPG